MGETREAAAPGPESRLLFFRSAGGRFALDVGHVREIVPPLAVTPVPFVPDTVAGIVNHRGAVFTLVRFARLAGFAADRPGAVVLLRLPDLAVGLAVEAVEGIEQVVGGLEPAATEGAPIPPAPFLKSARDASGRVVHAIDAERLAETLGRIAEPSPAREREQGAGHDRQEARAAGNGARREAGRALLPGGNPDGGAVAPQGDRTGRWRPEC